MRQIARARLAIFVSTAVIAGSLSVLAAPAASADPATDWDALVAAVGGITTSGTVQLGTDISNTDTSQLHVATGATVTLDLNGNILTINSANVPASGAGIHVPVGATLIIEDTVGGSSILVTGGSGNGGANDGQGGGAGIGGNGASDHTSAGETAGTVEIVSGNVVAHGGSGENSSVDSDGGGGGAGVGGGGGGGETTLHGGAGGTLTVDASGSLEATAGSGGAGAADAIPGDPGAAVGGGGSGGGTPSTVPGATGHISNAGQLILDSDEIMQGAVGPGLANSFTNEEGGTITVNTLLGDHSAEIVNDGTILTGPSGTIENSLEPGANTFNLLIDDNAYNVDYELNDSPDIIFMVSHEQRFIFSDSFNDAGVTLPAGPTPPDGDLAFVGWNTAMDGSGTFVTDTTDLPTAFGVAGPAEVTLYAQYLAADNTVGDWPALVADVAAIPATDTVTVQLAHNISNTTTDQLAIPDDANLTLDLNGNHLQIDQANVPAGKAGISVPETSMLNVEDSGSAGSLTVTGGDGVPPFADYGAAGIGGDALSPGGSVTVYSGTVTATGGAGSDGLDLIPIVPADSGGAGGGAGIGSGGGTPRGTAGGVVNIEETSTVVATGGAGGSASDDFPAGGGGAGIGGGGGSGGGLFGLNSAPADPGSDGAAVVVESGATLTSTGGAGPGNPGDAIGGGGGGGGAASGAFGSLDNSGLITVKSALTGPTTGTGLATNDGTILTAGSGSIDDTLADPTSTLTIDDNAFDIAYAANGGTSPPADQLVYSDDLADAGQTLPAGPHPPAGKVFTGWNTAADGSGTGVTASTSLASAAGPGPIVLTLFAQYTTAPESPALPASTVTVSSADESTVYGQPVSVTATINNPAVGAARPRAGEPVSGGTAQLRVDGVNIGTPQPVSNGHVSFPALTTLGVGSHTVEVEYTPAPGSAGRAGGGSYTQVVDKASTTTRVVAHDGQLSVTVSAVAPGAGTPTGTVVLTSAGATPLNLTLSGGTASTTSTTAGVVQATYGGDANFTSSAGSTAEQDPTITATITSKHHQTKAGWYRGPVTITFSCTPGSAAVTAACPSPVTLTANGAHHAVSRTIHATDGGIASVTVTGIKIDHTGPVAHVHGATSGHTYRHSRKLRCVATDALSGLASCTIHTARHHVVSGKKRVNYTATAIDKAGNVTTKHGHYFIR